MYDAPRFTRLACRISDRAVIIIPNRRDERGPKDVSSFTRKANDNARRAAKAALRGRKGN
jgi:hypothetical protein